ncbi:hypothetical protein ACFLWR_03115 [Chloroflexota bacterium]
MSKFIEALNQLSQGDTQPIGFTQRAKSSPKAKIQIVISLAAERAESLINHVSGADAGLITASKATAFAEAMQKVSGSTSDITWGGWMSDTSPAKAKQLSKAGGDFMVFSATDTTVISNENDKTGKILAVDAFLNEGLLRAVNKLPLDAVLITSGENQSATITWQRLMIFRRFADLLTKPLLVSVQSQVTSGMLMVLWEAGVMGVVMEMDEKQPEDGIKKLRQDIDKMDFSSTRKSERTEISLPRTGRESATTAPEIEEEY